MRHLSFTLIVVVLLATVHHSRGLGAASSAKDDVIVVLKDGSSFQGRITKRTKTDLILETAFGERTVPLVTLTSESPADFVLGDYRQRAAAAKPDDVDFHETMFKWCISKGLTDGIAAEMEEILRRDPGRTSVAEFVAKEAMLYRIGRKNPHDPTSGRWSREQIDILWDAAAKSDFARASVIRTQLAALPMDANGTIVTRFAERGSEPQRWIAAYILGHIEENRRVQPLFKMSFLDSSWQVRREAVLALKRRDDGTTYRPFVRALMQGKNFVLQSVAAEALGNLGDRRAVAPLVYALRASTDAPKAHVNITGTNQVAYIKDYDVEVAQTAFIADPLVDIVQDGFVLDVTTIITIQAAQGSFARALRRLTGESFESDPTAWNDWWKKAKSEPEWAAVATPR